MLGASGGRSSSAVALRHKLAKRRYPPGSIDEKVRCESERVVGCNNDASTCSFDIFNGSTSYRCVRYLVHLFSCYLLHHHPGESQLVPGSWIARTRARSALVADTLKSVDRSLWLRPNTAHYKGDCRAQMTSTVKKKKSSYTSGATIDLLSE
jgi:hypothetical protein